MYIISIKGRRVVGSVQEMNLEDNMQRQEFDNTYGFDADSLEDFPVENGCRTFNSNGFTVVCSEDPIALAAQAEMLA